MDEILILKPVFKEKIWGSNKLKEEFGYDIPSDKTGECWAISAHKDGSSFIDNGVYKGKTLREVYEENKFLFDNIKDKEFPLLVKFISASDDLSVQVHPNDKLAKNYNDLGKTECWYILDSKKNNSIVYGHNAKTKDEFIKLINENKWGQLLKEKQINKGDFIFVPAGKIHAIKKHTLLIEIQQSSNITFRLYDYNRPDRNGKLRQLHIDDAILATKIPDQETKIKYKIRKKENNIFTTLIKNKNFKVEKWDISNPINLKTHQFMLVSVIKGSGKINNYNIKKGSHLIVTSLCKKIDISGNLELIITTRK